MYTRRNFFFFWILWTLSSGLAWFVVIYPGFSMREIKISSWNSLLPIAGNLFTPALFLGFLVGVFQYALWKLQAKASWQWIVCSAFGYGLGTPISFLIQATGLGLAHPEILSANGRSLLSMPLGLTMLLSGLIVGLIQIPAYPKRNSAQKRVAIHWLWILASSLAWGIGFGVASYSWGLGWSIKFQSALAGIVVGLITGGVIFLDIFQTEGYQK